MERRQKHEAKNTKEQLQNLRVQKENKAPAWP